MTLALCFVLAVAPQSAPASTTSISIQLRAAGQRTPVSGVRIMAVPDESTHRAGRPLPSRHHIGSDASPRWLRSATTDEAGHASLDDLEGARIRVVVVSPGYERLEQKLGACGANIERISDDD